MALIGGTKQSSQNFVYMVQAIDYTGKNHRKTGKLCVVTLINLA